MPDPEVTTEELRPGPPAAPPSRWLVLALGAVVLTAVVAGTALATGVLNFRGISGEPGESASVAPSATASLAPSATEPPGASPSAAPSPSPPVAVGVWAEVVLADVPVHATAALNSAVIGTLATGQLVFAHSDLPIEQDGYRWYDIQATPNLRGWVTDAAEGAYQLKVRDVTGTLEWCGVPSERVYPVAEYEPRPFMVLGEVPLSTSLFSAAALGTADIAWADGTQGVCAVLQITNGSVSSARFDADFETCGKPASGAYGWGLDYRGGGVAPDGEGEEIHYILVSDAVLGYSQINGDRQNPDQIAQLAGAGSSFSEKLACLRVTISGGRDDTQRDTVVSAEVCANVLSIDSDHLVLVGAGEWDSVSHVEFDLNPGSVLDPALQPGATFGMRVESDDGVDAPLRLTPVTIPGCG